MICEQLPAENADTAVESITSTAPVNTTQPLNRMRSAIARTTSSSWQTIPHFYLSRDVEMDKAEQFIHDLKPSGTTVTLNALIMAAVSAALTRYPTLNSGFESAGITGSAHVNLGFAVALDDGLQVPVIKEAETKSLSALTDLAAALVEKARLGTLTPADISGGSFTVSNLGMYGIDALVSIIMPGQAAILGLGTIADRPVVREGQLAIGRIMTATLSCDHRIVDGATAAGFINEWKTIDGTARRTLTFEARVAVLHREANYIGSRSNGGEARGPEDKSL